jgi:hypothetical protein
MATNEIPDGAACYICLEEKADEEGKPPVRDCSCRGDSAGFAHFSCLAIYAKQKCKDVRDGVDGVIDGDAFCEPWKFCSNCKQPYQNQLALDLASAFVSFTEATYGQAGNSMWDKLKIITALDLKTEVLRRSTHEELERVELTKLINKIDQTKKDLDMSRWVHKPHSSEEYQYYKYLCGNYEASAHSQLGILLSSDTSEESKKIAITHSKKASTILRLVGLTDMATAWDTVWKYTALSAEAAASSIFQDSRNIYERNLNTWGMESENTIKSGFSYVKVLGGARHCIEAERLATKIATISNQVHGPHHTTTIMANESLEWCKRRCVIVLPDEDKLFHALRYENDGEICVVCGPILEPRNIEDERIHHIANTLVIPLCPVMCNGLVCAPHLNGELGEVRNYKQDETGIIRLVVYFEKRGKRGKSVKPENLRIAFDLPSED